MKKRIFFDLLVILIIGLIPLLWFKDNTVILGHDSGLPLDSLVHFKDRLYVWSQRFGIGTDQSYALLGAFFIHGFEALLSFIGFTMQQVQKIQFIFWFTLPGLAMYYFVYKIWPEKRYMALTAAIVYMINYYLIQAWFIAERTKFSIYIAFPIVMYFLIAYLTKKIGFFKSVIISGLTLSLLNGGGSFPLYGGLVVAILISYVYINLIYLNFETIKRTVLFSLGFGIVYVLLNSYWLISYYYYVLSFYGRDLANAGGADGVLTWVKYLSKGSTFINLLRAQGIPEWYLNDFHPYASVVLYNPIFKIISYGFPILALLPLAVTKLAKDKFYIYLLLFIALAGILLSAGTNSQLGFIFELMVRYVPGFAMFRSAFYKFDYIVLFSFSILIGFSINYLLIRINEKRFNFGFIKLPNLIFLFFILIYLGYHYPILNGSFFDFNNDPKGSISTRITVPDYVFEFGEWANKQDPNKRYLVLPELNDSGYISYKWGFWSLAPVSSLLSRNSFVQNTALIPGSEKLLLKQMYNSLLVGDIDSFLDFADIFAIDSIIIQKDYDWKSSIWGTNDPKKYEDIVNANSIFELEKEFGEWKIYKIKGRDKSLRVSMSSSLNFLQGELGDVVSFPYFNPRNPLYITGSVDDAFYSKVATQVFLGAPCIGCDLKEENIGFEVYNPKLLPGSPLYKFMVTRKEERVKESANDFMSKINYYLTTADRRSIEIKWMVEFRQNLGNLQNTIYRHNQSLVNLKDTLSSDNWGLDSVQEENLAKDVRGHLITQASLITSVHNDDNLTLENRLTLASSYELLTQIIDIVHSKQWVTDNAMEKKYLFRPPVTGNYEVFVKRNSLANPSLDINRASLYFREDGNVLKPLSQTEDWISFGFKNSSSDILHMAFTDPTVENLVAKISPIITKESGITKHNESYIMTGDSLNKCFGFPLSGLEVGYNKKYIISFSYRNFTSNKTLSISVDSNIRENASLRTKETLLPSKQNWTLFRTPFSSSEPNVAINFCNGFTSINEIDGPAPWLNLGATNHGVGIKAKNVDQESGVIVSEIKDVAIYKVSEPNVVLYKKKLDISDNNTSSVDYIKKNPVEYDVKLDKTNKPTFITMRESFGKFWQVCQENSKCVPFESNQHFADAGFMNSWYFEKGIAGKLNFYYYPQRTLVMGAIVSIISYLVILIWLIYDSIIRRRNRK